jgi:hypothetical protein
VQQAFSAPQRSLELTDIITAQNPEPINGHLGIVESVLDILVEAAKSGSPAGVVSAWSLPIVFAAAHQHSGATGSDSLGASRVDLRNS